MLKKIVIGFEYSVINLFDKELKLSMFWNILFTLHSVTVIYLMT